MELEMHTLINQLAEELANGIRPAIPLSIDLWNYEMIAAYLKKSPQQVRQRYAALQGFPQAIRLRSCGKEKGHPLWKAEEIITWLKNIKKSASLNTSPTNLRQTP